MLFKNANVLTDQFVFQTTDVSVADDVIQAVGNQLPYDDADMVIDCQGYYLVPGFVDIHVHGCAGTDASDGTRAAIENMATFLIGKGVTSFCPTTMSATWPEIQAALQAAKSCMDRPCEGAAVVGVNMEGPFLSEARKGAQKAENLLQADFDAFAALFTESDGIIRLLDIAPEMADAAFIQQASRLCKVSIAHTTADYDEAVRAFDAGISHATHLFNAMSGLSHRAPGVVGAVFDRPDVTAELICDGQHIHPAVLRTAFRLLHDRAVIVSDSMRANGMPEGTPFDLGGQMVTVENGRACLPDGTIAGSVTNLHEEVCNLVSYGIPLADAVKAATLIPATVIGMEHCIGSITPGKRADLVVLDENLQICAVYHNQG